MQMDAWAQDCLSTRADGTPTASPASCAVVTCGGYIHRYSFINIMYMVDIIECVSAGWSGKPAFLRRTFAI